MVNYQNSKIYKIEPTCEHEQGDIYIGSTTKEYLSQRMDKHRSSYRSWLAGKASHVRAYDLFNKYGLENCGILLIENYPCESRDELLTKEAHQIRTLDCVNKTIPGRTNKEYREENKDRLRELQKQYYENNKTTILQNCVKYRENNKTKLKEHFKKHYQENKEKILEKQKTYYEENVEKIKSKCKVYRDKHKDKNAEYQKAYVEANKEKLKAYKKQYNEKNKQKYKDRKLKEEALEDAIDG
jgi:hypothetical protein